MAERRKALGRGLGALIPDAKAEDVAGRPVDVFFPKGRETTPTSTSADSTNITQKSDSKTVDTSANTAMGSAARARAAAADFQAEVADRKKKRSTRQRHTPKNAKTGAGNVSRETSTKSSGAQGPSSGDKVPDGDSQQLTTSTKKTPPRAQAVTSTNSSAKPSDVSRETSTETATGDDNVVAGARFTRLPVAALTPNLKQPRTVFDPDQMLELSASIAEVGVLQPIVVRKVDEENAAHAAERRTSAIVDIREFAPADRLSLLDEYIEMDEAPIFEIIMGERRWRASILAGEESIPAIVRETDDEDLLRDALLENLHRAQLDPLEEASAYQQLLQDFSCTHEELATRLARSRPQITNTLRLLKLPVLVQRRVAAGVLSAGHARALLGLSDPGAMERLAQRIVAEGLSVRSTEEIVATSADDEPGQEELRRRPRRGRFEPELNALAGRLADRFDTRVKVNLGQRKGRISIDFANVDDLERILQVLSPGETSGISE